MPQKLFETFQTGKRQHYQLGQFTRTRYDGFIPTKYDPEVFRAQTTDVDRTHMSCQSNLAGLFPPTEDEMFEDGLYWQPIPVHPISTKIFNGNCEITNMELAYLSVKDPLFSIINKQFATTYDILTKNSGQNVTSLSSLWNIWDTLYIETRFNRTLPDWTKSIYPEPITTLNGYGCSLNTYTTEMKRLSKYRTRCRYLFLFYRIYIFYCIMTSFSKMKLVQP